MLNYIFIGLFFLVIIQLVMIKSKKSAINYEKQKEKAAELMTYLEDGHKDSFDGEGNNILMLAAKEEPFCLKKRDKDTAYTFTDVIKKALSLGIDINSQSEKEGNTALLYACSRQNDNKAADLLLENGADSNIINNLGRTPFWVVCFIGDYQLFERLLPLTKNINIQDKKGFTPLMAAAGEGHIGMVRDLLDKGVNVHLKNNDGDNAFTLADKNKSRHYKRSSNSASSDLSYAKFNHSLNEMVRRLYCVTNHKTFKPKRFTAPSGRDHYGVDE